MIVKSPRESVLTIGNLPHQKIKKLDERVLFIAERSNWSDLANQFIQEHFLDVDTLFWSRGEAYPSKIDLWEGDRIFSFKSDLILSEKILNKAQKCALNFHPAPPKYRGIGGYNYAIYNSDTMFGVTCHHMVNKVDFGEIIQVIHFPILNSERSSSLRVRTGAFCLTLLYEIIIQYVLRGTDLPQSNENWGNDLYTYSKLEKFTQLVMQQQANHNCIN
jgi:methionyl-tRNA formyltransferase